MFYDQFCFLDITVSYGKHLQNIQVAVLQHLFYKPF